MQRKAVPAAQARPAGRRRQAYRGGWPLGFTTAPCPAEAPVGCQSNPAYNLNCCPSGQFCFGTLQPYCCPTDNDCGPAVKALPVCANSTWTMFHIEQVANLDFFCCPPGYIGVLPSADRSSGVCEVEGVDLPKSRLATKASQVGRATASTPTLGAPTGGGDVKSTGAATSAAPSATDTGSSVPGNGAGAGGNGSSEMSTGGIIGAVLGSVAVLALIVFLVWVWRTTVTRRRESQPGYQEAARQGGQDKVSVEGAGERAMYEVPAASRVEIGGSEVAR